MKIKSLLCMATATLALTTLPLSSAIAETTIKLASWGPTKHYVPESSGLLLRVRSLQAWWRPLVMMFQPSSPVTGS